ncbi:Alginate biosynthesis sensor protein KinB [Planctomycetes bacterium Poly30]|uniref:histidine kinase n=1 Tax=Saltatorellus ferox TaxID=2528018 RepID=A0A518EXL8_9BACT|nr:Alginate biosynthesis sensor protein KinB [Planctomycetes bacterium Poly30]
MLPPSTAIHTGETSPALPRADTPVRLVVLDDDDFDIEVFRRCVSSIQDLSLTLRSFHTAEAVWEELGREPCDLLFVDYHLEGTTGLDAKKLLNARGFTPPTILVTDGHGDDVMRDAVNGGFADYIPKRSVLPVVVSQVIRSSLEKARLQAQIEQNQRDLAETVKSLESSREEIRRFYHSVSHELKTPLTGAREFVSLVQDGVAGAVTDEQSDLLGAAIRNCDRMVTCINDMLDSSRIETGKLHLKRVVCSFGAVVEDAVKSLLVKAEEKQIEVHVALERGPALDAAFIDPVRIFQVIGNLVSNAIKFTPTGGTIHVSARATEGGSIEASVRDSGCGLSASNQGLVFERLFQSRDDDAATLGGLGMGLFICRELVRLHGGEISVRSKEGAGAEFTFLIPALAPGAGLLSPAA